MRYKYDDWIVTGRSAESLDECFDEFNYDEDTPATVARKGSDHGDALSH
jgi:hypothetical protein